MSAVYIKAIKIFFYFGVEKGFTIKFSLNMYITCTLYVYSVKIFISKVYKESGRTRL